MERRKWNKDYVCLGKSDKSSLENFPSNMATKRYLIEKKFQLVALDAQKCGES